MHDNPRSTGLALSVPFSVPSMFITTVYYGLRLALTHSIIISF